jgi:hypothetical protein
MAIGDLIVFEEAKEFMLNGDILALDEMWCGLVTDVCVVTDPVPGYGAVGTTQYTPIATAGAYAAGGLNLGAMTVVFVEAGGTLTFDSATNPTWAQNGASPQDGRFAVVYNHTTKLCYVMIDLGAAIDMQAGDLTITWNASGLFTMV